MQTLHDIAPLREQIQAWRQRGESIGLVPTMGNLHAGHVALVRSMRQLADRVVVTIFVNPLQFGANEDLDAYPRTLAADQEKLAAAGADLLFAPADSTIYPRGREGVVFVEVPGISDILCGATRPGHFRGVATVVAKLFNLVQPDHAIFGEKDYQQLLVLRRMAADLDFPVTLHAQPIEREADGLAMSSRNGYLTTEERAIAPRLQATLKAYALRVRAGERDFGALSAEAAQTLERGGLRCDYFEFCDASDLSLATAGSTSVVILAAAYLGRARLIDNLMV